MIIHLIVKPIITMNIAIIVIVTLGVCSNDNTEQ